MSALPKKSPRYVVEFAYGDAAGSFARVTNWSDEVTHDGDVYAPVPLMMVKVPASTGVFEEPALEIEVPVSAHALFAELGNGDRHSPTFVTVTYLAEPLPDDGGTADPLICCLYWRVGTATKNASGKRGILRIEAVDSKAEMKTAVGLPANFQCAWTLYGRGCDLAIEFDTGTLTAVGGSDRKQATITSIAVNPGVPGSTPGNTYHRGYVERNGLRIEIRDYDAAAPTIFHLVHRPPAEWVGQTVKVVAGCDKSRETCLGRWANIARFQGCGYAIPARHPVHEGQ